MYSVLYKYYDTLMTDFNYDAYEKFLCDKITGSKGLDLACGSGAMTIRLKGRGFDMTGADYSAEMLNLAIEKAKKNRFKINFLYCDLNSLSIEKKYDFIISVCDGFNYIESNEKLINAFKAVYAALNNGGHFIFDVSTEYKLKNVLGNNLFFEDGKTLSYFWQNSLIKNKVVMNLSFFEKEDDGRYSRYDESQTQYIHDDNRIVEALEKTGFKYELFNENFDKYSKGDNRLVIVAGK